MLSNSNLLQVPRNFFFLKKLPSQFRITTLEEKNTITEGTWYLVDVHIDNNVTHKIHLLSQVKLDIAASYLVQKKEPLALKIIQKLN